ncbi:hypothetical protein ACFQY4_18100 [Catellatospora bangladeshensis]|uniref:Uncharacterized protein n=1 Tax=Catellatospora bangladeshensis TaxID=310355 RepID=A0A8J3NI47_9ACTN|nr:hypothetical protein [Catellatospora bangladeshensis]GIF82075.1 hypothetical protein Cba03nite_34240 [Catellatospora bangladeshensis]
MKPSEMGKVLAKCAAFDSRTVGESDVMAWHEAVGHLDFEHAMQAVSRFYATSRQRMWPVDLVETVRMVRAEHERRERLATREPQRLQTGDIGDPRLRAAVRSIAQAASLTRHTDGRTDEVHQRALERARAERGQHGGATRRGARAGAPIDLHAVTMPPAWANDDMRELLSDAALHERGRPCGRQGCQNRRCNADDTR